MFTFKTSRLLFYTGIFILNMIILSQQAGATTSSMLNQPGSAGQEGAKTGNSTVTQVVSVEWDGKTYKNDGNVRNVIMTTPVTSDKAATDSEVPVIYVPVGETWDYIKLVAKSKDNIEWPGGMPTWTPDPDANSEFADISIAYYPIDTVSASPDGKLITVSVGGVREK